MTQSLTAPTYFSAPPIIPRPGELLDTATVVEGSRWLEPVGLMETFNCLPTDSVALFPCPATQLAAPVQTAATTAITGGTIAAGTYLSYVTAVNSRGETTVSNEISRVTTGAASTITFNWNAVSGATSYKLYVTSGATGTEKFLVNVAGTTYTWTGSPAVGTGAYPTANTAVVPVNKTFVGSSWQDGIRFAAYAGHVCKGVGYSENSLTEVERVFNANESVAVERAVMQQRMVVNGAVWAAAPDLTPAAGAVDATVGLAILEGWAAWHYAGVPTIHSPRSITTLLARNGAVLRVGDRFFSVQGSKIASGGGYEQPNTGPTGAAPAAGEKWMYASGEVVIARSEIESKMEMNRTTNEMFALVERLYVVAVDCFTAAVRVKVA